MEEKHPLISSSDLAGQVSCIQPQGIHCASGQKTTNPSQLPTNFTTGTSVLFYTQPQQWQPTTVSMVPIRPIAEPITPACDFMYLSCFACLCCIWPIGLIALCFSCLAKDANSEGRMWSAKKYGKCALAFSIVSIAGGIGVISYLLSVYL